MVEKSIPNLMYWEMMQMDTIQEMCALECENMIFHLQRFALNTTCRTMSAVL
jgi:hypothetical protein